jgi:hypothetical protein
MSIDLRSRVIRGGALQRKEVQLVVDGELLVIDMLSLSSADRGEILNTCMTTNDEGESVADQAKLGPRLVVKCAVAHGTTDRIFSDADVDVVGSLDAAFLDPLVKAGVQISGLAGESLKVAEGNSGKTTG